MGTIFLINVKRKIKPIKLILHFCSIHMFVLDIKTHISFHHGWFTSGRARYFRYGYPMDWCPPICWDHLDNVADVGIQEAKSGPTGNQPIPPLSDLDTELSLSVREGEWQLREEKKMQGIYIPRGWSCDCMYWCHNNHQTLTTHYFFIHLPLLVSLWADGIYYN